VKAGIAAEVGASVAAGASVAVDASVAGGSVAGAWVAGGSVAAGACVEVALLPPQAARKRLNTTSAAMNRNILVSLISLSF